MHGLKIVVQKLVNDNSNNSTQQSTALALLYDNLKLGVICYFYALSIKIDQGWPQVHDNCKMYYKKEKKGVHSNYRYYFTLKKRWIISMDRTVLKSISHENVLN